MRGDNSESHACSSLTPETTSHWPVKRRRSGCTPTWQRCCTCQRECGQNVSPLCRSSQPEV
jgi:hypothetical protein